MHGQGATSSIADNRRMNSSPGRAGPPAAALLLNAFVWGLSWWPLREMQAHGLHPLWATVLMYALAALAIAVWRPRALVQVCTQPALWILAAASGTTNAAFNWAVSTGDVVRVVLLFYLMPLWTVLLARVFLHERFSTHTLLRVALALAGAMIVLKPAGSPWPFPQGLPDWLGLLGGLAFAVNGVALRRLAHRTREEGRAVAMLLGCVIVAGGTAGLLSAQGSLAPVPPPQFAWVAIALGTALAFMTSNLAYQYGAARLPANVTSVVMLTEVVFASVSSVLIAGESLTPDKLLGGGLIVAAALLAALGPGLWGQRAERRAAPKPARIPAGDRPT